MATRMLSRRGLRSFAPSLALDREVQAAAKTIQAVGTKGDRLVAATSPAEVEDVLTESYLESVSDMAIPINPFANQYCSAEFVAAATEQLLPQGETDLFVKNPTAGTLAVPRVVNDLLEDSKPDHSMLVHNVGVVVSASIEGVDDVQQLVNQFRLDIWQGETRLLKIPVAMAMQGLIVIDADGTLVIGDFGPNTAGGYEIEGNGLPLVRADKVSAIKLRYFGSAFTTHATLATWAAFLVFIDGEKMEA